MCGTDLVAAMPQTTVTFTVTYAHETQRWYAHHCACSTGEEYGGYVNHGSMQREFGPFATAADVLQWVYREASATIRLMPVSGAPS